MSQSQSWHPYTGGRSSAFQSPCVAQSQKRGGMGKQWSACAVFTVAHAARTQQQHSTLSHQLGKRERGTESARGVVVGREAGGSDRQRRGCEGEEHVQARQPNVFITNTISTKIKTHTGTTKNALTGSECVAWQSSCSLLPVPYSLTPAYHRPVSEPAAGLWARRVPRPPLPLQRVPPQTRRTPGTADD